MIFKDYKESHRLKTDRIFVPTPEQLNESFDDDTLKTIYESFPILRYDYPLPKDNQTMDYINIDDAQYIDTGIHCEEQEYKQESLLAMIYLDDETKECIKYYEHVFNRGYTLYFNDYPAIWCEDRDYILVDITKAFDITKYRSIYATDYYLRENRTDDLIRSDLVKFLKNELQKNNDIEQEDLIVANIKNQLKSRVPLNCLGNVRLVEMSNEMLITNRHDRVNGIEFTFNADIVSFRPFQPRFITIGE